MEKSETMGESHFIFIRLMVAWADSSVIVVCLFIPSVKVEMGDVARDTSLLLKDYINEEFLKVSYLSKDEIRCRLFEHILDSSENYDMLPNRCLLVYENSLPSPGCKGRKAQQVLVSRNYIYYQACVAVRENLLSVSNLERIVLWIISLRFSTFCLPAFMVSRSKLAKYQRPNLKLKIHYQRFKKRAKPRCFAYGFAYGGGTMGQIRRKAKRPKDVKQLSKIKSKAVQTLYRMVLSLRMSPEEKIELPTELKERDSGGMSFPKKELIPFLEQLVQEFESLPIPLH